MEYSTIGEEENNDIHDNIIEMAVTILSGTKQSQKDNHDATDV